MSQMKSLTAEEAVRAAEENNIIALKDGVFLEKAESLIALQKEWSDGDKSKEKDFSSCPYWITTDDGAPPVGISGADDYDLIKIFDEGQE